MAFCGKILLSVTGGEGASGGEGLNDMNLSSCVFWNMICVH